MTIEAGDYRIELASNLFEANESLKLPPARREPPSGGLGCITIFRSNQTDLNNAAWDCANYAWTNILHALPATNCWLLASVLAEDNRLARRRGLWRALEAHGLRAGEQATPETIVQSGDGRIYMYGASVVARDGMGERLSVVNPGSRSFLVLLAPGQTPNVEAVIAAGWKRGVSDLAELANIGCAVGEQEGVLIRMFGEFDDREAGVSCVMGVKTYEHAVSAVRAKWPSPPLPC